MKAIKDIYLPPGIQMHLHETPPCGDYLHDFAVAQIDTLWDIRNKSSDVDVDKIDTLMESIVRSEADGAAYGYRVIGAEWTSEQVKAHVLGKLAAHKEDK